MLLSSQNHFHPFGVLIVLTLVQGLVAGTEVEPLSQVQAVRSVNGTKCCDNPGREEISIWLGPPEEESSWKMCLCWVLKANQRLRSRDEVGKQRGHYLLTLPRDVSPQRASVVFGCFQRACTSTTNINFLNFLPSPVELHHDHLSYFIILNIRPKLHLPPGLWASSFPAPLFSYLLASFSTSYPAH